MRRLPLSGRSTTLGFGTSGTAGGGLVLASALFTLAQVLELTNAQSAAETAAGEALDLWLAVHERRGDVESAESVVFAAALAARTSAALGARDRALDRLAAAAPIAHHLAALDDRSVERVGGLLSHAAWHALASDLPATGLEYASEAVALLARHAEGGPKTARAYGLALSTQATALDRVGRRVQALEVSPEAVTLYRRLAPVRGNPGEREPDRSEAERRARHDLATAIKNCAVLHERLGHCRDAGVDAETAADLYAELAAPAHTSLAVDLDEQGLRTLGADVLMSAARSWLAHGDLDRARCCADRAAELYLNAQPRR